MDKFKKLSLLIAGVLLIVIVGIWIEAQYSGRTYLLNRARAAVPAIALQGRQLEPVDLSVVAPRAKSEGYELEKRSLERGSNEHVNDTKINANVSESFEINKKQFSVSPLQTKIELILKMHEELKSLNKFEASNEESTAKQNENAAFLLKQAIAVKNILDTKISEDRKLVNKKRNKIEKEQKKLAAEMAPIPGELEKIQERLEKLNQISPEGIVTKQGSHAKNKLEKQHKLLSNQLGDIKRNLAILERKEKYYNNIETNLDKLIKSANAIKQIIDERS